MKKPFLYLFMSILFFAVCCLQIVKGQQDINLEYIISQNKDNPENIDIAVTAINGSPNYIFRLYDGDFMEDGQLVEESTATSEITYLFVNRPKEEFMICISDSHNTSVCKFIPTTSIPNE